MLYGSSGALSRNREEALASRLASQAQALATEIRACAASYPEGDNATPYRPNLPAAQTPTEVAALLCPGAPPDEAVLLPPSKDLPTIAGSDGWRFVNDAVSARLQTTVAAGNEPALDLAVQRLGAMAVRTGATLSVVVRE